MAPRCTPHVSATVLTLLCRVGKGIPSFFVTAAFLCASGHLFFKAPRARFDQLLPLLRDAAKDPNEEQLVFKELIPHDAYIDICRGVFWRL